MTAEEYRKKLMDTFHNMGYEHFIAVLCEPSEKGFEELERLLNEKKDKD